MRFTGSKLPVTATGSVIPLLTVTGLVQSVRLGAVMVFAVAVLDVSDCCEYGSTAAVSDVGA